LYAVPGEGNPGHESKDETTITGVYGRYTELRSYLPYEPRMMVKVGLYGSRVRPFLSIVAGTWRGRYGSGGV